MSLNLSELKRSDSFTLAKIPYVQTKYMIIFFLGLHSLTGRNMWLQINISSCQESVF